ncbi:ethanolamine ammonia-lyase reactivating factor EutA [Parendozoicomonas haliclonae]|uniref:Reactivating factor for ethanolamine ammonia lyase n=2 Tax=Parendozoicomonas haliclonae TaxID=1960125 RepID=A0A1X7ALW2_9GAMM|nr:reactivating factor for ethanolamine ammonia lyase [Parendozoicomonas haliclonae]
MIGLDFGTTTSSAMVAKAKIGLNCTTGRMGFSNPDILYRAEPVFTPYSNGRIQEQAIDKLLGNWLDECGFRPEQLFSGGVMITGMAARNDNAEIIASHVRSKFGDIIVATADDPSLESWLAFMGGTSVLSRFHKNDSIINLDIGGGTTNPALGINGQVISTGCSFIGARHFKFKPGTYELIEVSSFGQEIVKALNLPIKAGDTLSQPTLDQILDFYIAGLVATVTGDYRLFNTPVGQMHEQVRFDLKGHSNPVITYSGGVGELLYKHAIGEPWPSTTFFGDLGIDLSKRIAAHPLLSQNLRTHTPDNRGRATVYGLTLHSTEISGTTLYLTNADDLPLQDLPIVSRLPILACAQQMMDALELARKSSRGACLQILPLEEAKAPELSDIKAFGDRMASVLEDTAFPASLPLALLVPNDYGKAIGNYVSRWRNLPLNLTVIDEVPDRTASFVNVGAPQHHIIPVSFYGMQ